MKFVLGTAQLNHKYGINNKTKTNINNSLNIIRYAYKNKIKEIDTAPGYVNSQKIIGKIKKKFLISSKISGLLKIKKNNLETHISKQVHTILNELSSNSLYGVYFHEPEIFKNKSKSLFACRILNKFKKQNLLRKIGVSIYEPKILNNIFKIFKPDIVQFPLNIFDQRIIDEGWLDYFSKNNIETQARSIFLQGLLLMKPKDLPKQFNTWKKNFSNFHLYCKKNKLTPHEVSLNFIRKYKVDKTIIGIENIDQLKMLINYKIKSISNPRYLKIDDLNLIDPRLW
tara:strand:- start:364 stop:1215 length:852 start_codon:yes stop_codon:yes gene_type:complete